MRTQFAPDESTPYRDTVQALLRLCQAWCAEHAYPAPQPQIVRCACDARQHLGDGRLAHWTTDLLRDLLLGWFPRTAWIPPESWDQVIPSMHVWLDFLDACGLLDPRGEPTVVLHPVLDGLGGAFHAAMADPDRYGTSKVLAQALFLRGEDPGDPQARADLVADLARGVGELDPVTLTRARMVDLEHTGRDERDLPQLPVQLPPDAELDESAAQAPVVRRLVALTRWVGPDGRALVDGRLHPDEVRAALAEPSLADLAGIAGSGERSRLDLLVHWAKRAGLVRRYAGRLVQVKAAHGILDRPRVLHLRALRALFELRDQVLPPEGGSSLLYLPYPEVLRDVLFAVYSFPEPGADLGALEDSVWSTCAGRYDLDQHGEDARRRWRTAVIRDFHRVLGQLVELGAAARTRGPGGGDRLALTSVGTWSVRSLLTTLGRPAPLVGDLRDVDAHTLLYVLVEEYTIETGRAELAGWLAARGAPVPEPGTVTDPDTAPETPAVFLARAELSDALRHSPLRTRKAAMLGILTRCLPEGHLFAESLLEDPDLGPLAVQDLISTGHLALDTLPPHEGLLGLAESLAQLLEMGGPKALATQFAEHDPQAAMNVLTGVARSQHPHAERILRAVAPGLSGRLRGSGGHVLRRHRRGPGDGHRYPRRHH